MSSAGNKKTPSSIHSGMWKNPKPIGNKVILVDWSVLVFQSILAWYQSPVKSLPPTYLAIVSLLASLKRIGCQKTDTIILALDSPKGSWRRQFDSAYKADRKKKRERLNIDWELMFKMFSEFVSKLDASTPFIPIVIDYYEADDIIAFACRFYKASPCIIVSTDSDYQQLLDLKNVKIFSPKAKRYIHNSNPLGVLKKKIKKEPTDNLITPVLNEADYLKRLKIVNLLSLPLDVELEIAQHLIDMKKGAYDLALFPFQKLVSRFQEIYSDKYVVEDKLHRKQSKKLKQVNLLKEEK